MFVAERRGCFLKAGEARGEVVAGQGEECGEFIGLAAEGVFAVGHARKALGRTCANVREEGVGDDDVVGEVGPAGSLAHGESRDLLGGPGKPSPPVQRPDAQLHPYYRKIAIHVYRRVSFQLHTLPFVSLDF